MKRIFVFCDGTANTVTAHGDETNVLRLFQCVQAFRQSHLSHPEMGEDLSHWHLYYDPGVGAVSLRPDRTLGALGAWWSRTKQQALGEGVYENVAQAYQFIMAHWEPGCRIYLFGFSRGAFTARSVAGMVNLFGVLRREAESMLPSLLDIYFSSATQGSKAAARGNLAAQVKKQFSCPDTAWVDYVGVWDTVESVGLPLFRRHISSMATFWDKSFVAVRHALSIHEHRRNFKHRAYKMENPDLNPAKSPDGRHRFIEQQWFPGVHTDVGGGEVECGHSNDTLQWVALGLMKQEGLPSNLLDGLEVSVVTGCPASQVKRFHDELHASPCWALAGMTLRQGAPRRPRGNAASVWDQWRSPFRIGLAAMVCAVVLYWYASVMGGWRNVQTLAWLQLTAVSNQSEFLSLITQTGSEQATWIDFGLIGGLAYLLARVVGRAFQRLSIWHEHLEWLRPTLAVVGWVPLAYVIADVSENLLSLFIHSTGCAGNTCWLTLPLGVLSLISAAKFAALSIALALLPVWAYDHLARWYSRRHEQSAASSHQPRQ